jgi:hypothetical protein
MKSFDRLASYKDLAAFAIAASKKVAAKSAQELYETMVIADLGARADQLNIEKDFADIDLADEEFTEALESFRKRLNITAEQFDEILDTYKGYVFGTKTIRGLEDSLQFAILEHSRNLIDQGIQGDIAFADFKKQMEGVTDVISPARLQLIFRQNVLNSYSAGAWSQLYEATDENFDLIFTTSKDERVDGDCSAWDGFTAPKDDPVWQEGAFVPLHFNCVVGETIVKPGGQIYAAYKRMYTGEIIRIHASRGGLTCTPNHPILTDNGFIPAKDLTREDCIIRIQQIEPLLLPYGRPRETIQLTVDDIIALNGSNTVKINGYDFHGDGIGSESALMAKMIQSIYNRQRDYSDETISNIFKVPEFQIIKDKVLSIEPLPFSGYVYNLGTFNEVYTANGIVTGNCRCDVRMALEGEAGNYREPPPLDTISEEFRNSPADGFTLSLPTNSDFDEVMDYLDGL